MRRFPRTYYFENLEVLHKAVEPIRSEQDGTQRVRSLHYRALLDCMSIVPAEKFAAIVKDCQERDRKDFSTSAGEAAATSTVSGARQVESSSPAEPLRAEVTLTVQDSSSAGAIEKLAPTSVPAPDDICDECNHPISRHGKDGCEVELGDGYRGDRTVLEALGPCSCTAITCEPVETEGAA